MAIRHDAILPYYQTRDILIFCYPVLDNDGDFNKEETDLEIVKDTGSNLEESYKKQFSGSVKSALEFILEQRSEFGLTEKETREAKYFIISYYKLLGS